MKKIFHITTIPAWETAKIRGSYLAESLAKAGFIHCSLASQVPAVANINFKGHKDLILLEIEEAKVKRVVKYEDLANEGQLFPHIYGPLNVDAVNRIIPFPSQADGNFILPESAI